jgi:ABC-type branched-subunit amino acid transport system ATPase component/ABC-type branched-subunit amino acid transport system permease subunit
VNLGTFVLGLLNGLTIGLLAVGLALVYKSNRFINLAHAQLGTISALFLGKFVLTLHWNWWVAFVVSIGAGVLVGLVVERLFVRPLRARNASPISLLLLTVGVSQLLLAATFIPGLTIDSTSLYPQPFVSHVRVGGVVLSATALLTVFLVPALALALAAFLRYSVVGKSVRAAASNPDAARLCGISTARVSAITWGAAGGLSAVSAILQAPTQPSFNIASLGPYLLMLTLGAAALGAFVSLPAALSGGVLLGLVSQVVASHTGHGPQTELVVFGVILAIVLVRGRAISRVFASSGGAVPERAALRVPTELRASALVRFPRMVVGLPALFAALLLPSLPYFRTEPHRFLLVLVLIYAVVGVSLTMLIGWAGQVSLGHIGVVGIGAFLTAKLVPHGWNLVGLFLVAGVLGAAVMVVVGLPALRVRGLTLAVTTLGLAVIAPDWLFRQSWFGSTANFGIPVKSPNVVAGVGAPHRQLSLYYVGLTVLALALVTASALRRSSPGRITIAVRDNERASAAFGVTPATVKLAILSVSGFFAGVAGVLWADTWHSVSTSHFAPEVSISVLAIPVIGGLGSLAGAVAAACLIYLPAFFIGPHLSHLFGSAGQNLGFQLFLAGAGLVGTMLAYPTGIAGVAQRTWERMLTRRAASRSEGASGDASVPLAVTDIRVRFGGVVALDGASITVEPGEIVGLIGPNGAGKTTLVNVISGVLQPQSGSVRVNGHEVGDLAPDIRAAYGLGRGFQDATLFPGLTVTETIQVALARTNRVGVVSSLLAAPWVRSTERRTRARAHEVLERFGLEPWADALTSELSTGTRRICDLAMQVAAGPNVLLLDEPTAGVAQREAEAFGPLLRRIRDELDCSILIVEHDMPLLMGLCDRVYAMDAGRMIAEAAPDAIRNDPAVIASYLGTDEVAISRSGNGRPARRTRQLAAAASGRDS